MDYGNVSPLEGISFMAETVKQLLGISIDYYAGLDFEGFVSLIDLIGRVELKV